VPGLLQRLLKTNAKNSGGSDTGSGRGLHVRDRRPPRGLVTLTDAVNALDARWLSADAASVGLAFLAERR